MSLSYFLGSNSHKGFSSLYDGFCSAPKDYLHIIKGGPGCGKSGLMRRVAQAAEERGYTVEYLLCSGDPDSLDGVYIRELQQGWMDGTAPHVREVHRFGLDSDYVDLGAFCRTPIQTADLCYVSSLYERYQAAYAKAYQALQAAEAAASLLCPHPLPSDEYTKYKDTIWEIIRNQKRCSENNAVVSYAPPAATATLHVRRCFLRGITCHGILLCEETIYALCKLNYCLFLSPVDCDLLLADLSLTCEQQGLSVLLCCDPREPKRIEGLLLPSLSLGFWARSCPVPDALPLSVSPREEKRKTRQERRLIKTEASFQKLAVCSLSEAKALHDELEGFTTASMDFAALNDFTKEHISRHIS